LRSDSGRDVPLQQARSRPDLAAELSVLPPEDGGRLGLGQEQANPHHPARRGLDLERRDGDEPSLTAEALAEKIGESLSTDDDL
jgi:hypothetical protein